MGAVDSFQVESRAAHRARGPPPGDTFPKFRADPECARWSPGGGEAIEPTVVPRNPLDVLAQQTRWPRRATGTRRRGRPVRARTHTYWFSRWALENADMLDGRYPSS
jgi:ATP-dependent Lhr-like helicase